ncbi:hypothetical protein [Halopseudomonas yangmingensis]|uniref:Uncharacterized protein n=1 Tax=Halopseudomonas yangmingensis TaxID=1720063 RepID=A0A1I4URB4_9GAMM|nr:hypothetical protein [Halopseudomonas yangmingensis]SFM91455.1 hypothetical protein SAMN05216217_1325 [Halopseudomonas yangmingensis]
MPVFEGGIRRLKFHVLFMLVFLSLLNAFRYIGSMHDFVFVILLHLFFGRSLYQYVVGQNMFLGGVIGADAGIAERRVGAVISLVCFCAVFFY